jgi:AsmA-like C-terminal region
LKVDPTLIQLLKLAQLGPVSANLAAFSTIRAEWQLSAGVLTAPRIHIASQGANIDGSGTVGIARGDRLDFHGVISLAAHRNALSNFLAAVTGASFRGNKMTLPFIVSGTLKKPVFGLKTAPRFGVPAPSSGK